MDLASLPTQSDKLYLRNFSQQFADLEGPAPDDETEWPARCAWVVVKFASEGDLMNHGNLTSRRETKFAGLGTAAFEMSDVVVENPRELMLHEVFWTLSQIGNLMVNGELLKLVNLKFKDFREIWKNLPPQVTDAIHQAVVFTNPMWS